MATCASENCTSNPTGGRELKRRLRPFGAPSRKPQPRDFPHRVGEIPPRGSTCASVPHRKPSDFARPLFGCPDRVLPLNAASIDVFRAAVVSIVLTLTLGQNASLLCRIWCHPAADAASASCEHQNVSTSPGVTGSDRCTQPTAATAFVPEDLRRARSAHEDYCLIVPQFTFASPSMRSPSGDEPGRATLETRPLVLALRI